ncbi:MAG: YifB family Mg chelatase-like AAA ATPase [Atribacterota bacterium]
MGENVLARILSATTWGIEAKVVEVEVDVGAGLPAFQIVGLPDAAVQESRERVRSAIKNSGFSFPAQRVTVNLAPAFLKKSGSDFDLPIALGILLATAQMKLAPSFSLSKLFLIGELSLSGEVKPVNGILPIAHFLSLQRKSSLLLLSLSNATEGALVEGIKVFGFRHLGEIVDFLTGKVVRQPLVVERENFFSFSSQGEDLSDVKGQKRAKRALEIAASGGHHLLFIGPPGSGKTMLARRIPSLLPLLSLDEAIEVTKIHSVAGLLSPEQPLVTERPFRAPHHTISDAALIGGGQWPRPGEISLAHHGVLFLDEVLEFRRNVLETLREPLEMGKITVSRAQAIITYPARFILVLACNPCPCGYLGDTQRVCTCSPRQVAQYRSKLSGPLLDRIDLQVEVPRLEVSEVSVERKEESSSEVRQRVERARAIQRERFTGDRIMLNGDMKTMHLKKFCLLTKEAKKVLEDSVEKLALSMRAYHHILKVARTIADLEEEENIQIHHVAEAIQYRSLDRRWE